VPKYRLIGAQGQNTGGLTTETEHGHSTKSHQEKESLSLPVTIVEEHGHKSTQPSTSKVRAGQGLESSLRPFKVAEGFPTPDEIKDEIEYMYRVLLGHEPAPVDKGITTLMEIADAYYARAYELTSYIRRAEQRGDVVSARNSKDPYYQVRTGQLADFLEACKRSVETGSRRLSAAQLEFNQHERGLAIDSEV
jgi:hypothetical protein